MSANLFNLGRYFNKQTDDSSPPVDDTNVSQTAVPYSGIGKTPQANVPYSGIGTPTKQPAADNVVGAIDPGKRAGMDILTRLTQRSTAVLMTAASKATELGAKYVDTEHVLWGLLSDAQVFQLISELKVTPKEIQDYLENNFKKADNKSQPQFSPRVKKVLELALNYARSVKLDFVSPEHILLGLIAEGEGMAAQTLVKFNITQEVLNKKVTGKKEVTAKDESKKTSTIEEYCEDLTAKAKAGKLDPVVGRSAEIERAIHILSRRTKNNPVLIGDAGVGKTAIVEGLAQKIAIGDVPQTLINKRILQLDLMSLIAGARHRGEFEERLKNLIREIKASSGQIILFIDEIHNMVGAGSGSEGTMDTSNILKPSLARGELQTIGTTTIVEYRKYIEKDPALERRFQPINVLEPTEDAAIEMLSALRDKYEAFHKVSIPDSAIETAVRLSKQYVGDRSLPDKAVDLIDEAGAAVRLPAISLPDEIKSLQKKTDRLNNELKEAQNLNDQLRVTTIEKEIADSQVLLEEKKAAFEKKKSTTTNVVSPEIIQEIISRWTNIPVSKLTEKESDKLVKLEDLLHKRIIDQEQAVTAIAEAVRRGRAGLKSGKRPIGSFIFLGPTGVGKTELAKALAEILFGSEEMMVRLDMSEYMERHEVAKLIGSPPGYVGYDEGGQLTEAVRRRPYSVVLFDEIEKAHPDVFNILIQLLDDGRLTDNKGHTVSFKNTIVICTSNIGTNLIQKEMLEKKPANNQLPEVAKTDGHVQEPASPESSSTQPTQTSTQPDFNDLTESLLAELRSFFRPELLNRFDEITVFKPLSFDDMLKVVDLQVALLAELLKAQGLNFMITPLAKENLAQQGYDPLFGARPLRRTIQRLIENPISTLLIKGEAKTGDTINIDLVNGEFDFKISKNQNVQQPAKADVTQPVPAPEEKITTAQENISQPVDQTVNGIVPEAVNSQPKTQPNIPPSPLKEFYQDSTSAS